MSRITVGEGLALHHETEREVLPNGLTLLVRRDATAPVVAIVTHVKAGYFDECDERVGIAHVLEHMFFKGTPTRGVGTIARETKANGGYLNAHTIYDHTSYYTVLPSASFAQGLDIQFDAYANSLIDDGELARELEVIIQEAKRKRDTPAAVTIESLYALLHDHHRIRRWRIGDEAGLRTLTAQAVRSFYRAWYQPSNTIISIVGDIDPAVVRREVYARHGAMPSAPVPREIGPVERTPPGFRLREMSGDIAQQQVAFGWRAPNVAHPDTPALDLAGVALGTGRASRLYRAVRDRQLASSVSAWHYTTGDVGVFVVQAEATGEYAPLAAQQMWREVDAARTQGFRVSEVVRAQRILEARWLRRLETMDGQAAYLASWEAIGGIACATSYYDRLFSLQANTLQDATQRHLELSQMSVVSYHPTRTRPLATDADALNQWLRDAEGQGSSVLPPPHIPTPAYGVPLAVSTRARTMEQARVLDGVHVRELSGGVSVLVLPKKGAPLASIGMFQRGGASAGPDGREGLARLTAHAMLKGTLTRSGAQIAEAVEELGASISVSAALESLGWSLSVPVRYLAAAVATLADITQHPSFPDDGVDTERALALAEVTRLRDDMVRWPARLATQAAYGAHPYARTVIGTAESLESIDTAMVRAFHAEQIQRGATVIAVVGDVDPAATFSLIAREFTALSFREDDVPVPQEWPAGRLRAVEHRDKQQTALSLLFPGPARHDPERFTARVLSAVASGLGGRFFEQLRDRQSLAYTVSAYPLERRVGGAFAAYIATSPAREDEAREGLMGEFAKLRAAAPDATEIDRARRYLIGAHAIGQQVGSTVMGELVDAWLFGSGLGELREYSERIATVTAAQVQSFAERYFDPARVVEGIVRGNGGPRD
ncbi:MAG: pitrilysin family protein [Gemmatimonas sp.]